MNTTSFPLSASTNNSSNNVFNDSRLWQEELAAAIRDPAELLRVLDLRQEDYPWLFEAAIPFPLKVTRSFVQRMEKANPNDPLLLQVLPDRPEFYHNPEGLMDPVGDLASRKVPGLLHKYQGRALLITAPSCAGHCRYCFRRHFPYQEPSSLPSDWTQALRYVREHPDIEEIILSGGDPLVLSDHKLQTLLGELNLLPQLTTIRIHSRTPVFAPSRITDSLCEMLGNLTKSVVMVLHINHANEIDELFKTAMKKLASHGIRLYNQSVLLRGVNDRADTLIHLSKSLFNIDIQPYYLHLLDPVQGAMHYSVPKDEALKILQQVRQSLPGYLVPQLVQEIPGTAYKQPIIQFT